MTKRAYQIEYGAGRHRNVTMIEATPHEAAKKAARLAARGDLRRDKTIYEQPDNARMPDKVRLLDDTGAVLMTCGPSIISSGAARAGRRVRYTFARCSIKPGFKKLLRKRRRR